MKQASNSSRISSIVIVLPTITLHSIVTPSASRSPTSASRICLGRRNSGMPYRSTPPAACSASKTVTSWPAPASAPAAVNPPGPEPTITTFLPVGEATAGRDIASAWAMAQSAMNRSR